MENWLVILCTAAPHSQKSCCASLPVCLLRPHQQCISLSSPNRKLWRSRFIFSEAPTHMMGDPLRFVPFNSMINPGFWSALAKQKLDVSQIIFYSLGPIRWLQRFLGKLFKSKKFRWLVWAKPACRSQEASPSLTLQLAVYRWVRP